MSEQQRSGATLSAVIDHINHGEKPNEIDSEIEGLIETVLLLKRASHQLDSSSLMIDLMTNLIFEERESQKRTKRRFWFGSALAALATVIVLAVFAANYFTGMEPPRAVQESSLNQEEVSSLPLVNSSTDINLPPPVPLTNAAEKPAEQPVIVKQPVSRPTEKAFYRPAAKHSDSSGKVLLPGTKPDTVDVDKESGVIRQVYNAGGDKEFVVTQGLPRTMKETPDFNPKEPSDANSSFGTSELNKVVVTLGGVDVTVEGHQTMDELQKIGTKLVVK